MGPVGRARRFLLLAPVGALAVLACGFVVLLGATLGVISEQGASACGLDGSSPVSAPTTAGPLSAAQIVLYLESQSLTVNAAAGIEGNLQQESNLNPLDGGGGIAQWNPKWYGKMAAYATANGLSPTSDQGQLAYLVYDLRTGDSIREPNLLAQLNAAPTPEVAATMFETGYELCSGYVSWMVVAPNSLCDDPNRQTYAASAALAASAGGTAVPVSLVGASCGTGTGVGGDPIPGFRPGRDDMGVDACAATGAPIYAPLASTLVGVQPTWYGVEPLLLFRFDQDQPGTPDGTQYWYVAEEIVPVTEATGTDFQAGEPVATFAPSGTCIEIGWGVAPGTPNAPGWALAQAKGDSAAANPAYGALTQWGETFKSYFHIPWVGTSP